MNANDNDKMVVPYRYIRAVQWIKEQISIHYNDFPSLMFTLGSFASEIDNLQPQIIRYEESQNEN